MGSIAVVYCHLDAWAESGMKRKNGWGAQGRDFSIVVKVCSNCCCSHGNVLMCVYFDQSCADKVIGVARKKRTK